MVRVLLTMSLVCALLSITYPTVAAEVTQAARLRVSTNPSASQHWIGFATSHNGRVFQSNPNSEQGARDDARLECEARTQRSCRAIAVTASADMIVVRCQIGGIQDAFVAGSGINQGAARYLAYEKAARENFHSSVCQEVFSY